MVFDVSGAVLNSDKTVGSLLIRFPDEAAFVAWIQEKLSNETNWRQATHILIADIKPR